MDTKMNDLKGLLELLHTNNDVNLQLKLFSMLSAKLMSNETNIDIIIKCNSLYDKICTILSNCPPRNATVMFNFLAALLYNVDEDGARDSLVVYAKNMIRGSGCLAIICELFTSCMMHQDAWRSLCRCLAETCHKVEANQSYCTHLVPICIQRCSQSNIEVFLVLQSLLQNHSRNASLFIECNGISIFQREFLRHNICLQLLNTLVQCFPGAIQHIHRTGVRQNLEDFLNLYGPQSQLGQWATIILYHISGTKDTHADEVLPVGNQTKGDGTVNNSCFRNPSLYCSTDTTRFLQNVMKEIQRGPPSDVKYLQNLFSFEPHPGQGNNKQIFNHQRTNQQQRSSLWTNQNITSASKKCILNHNSIQKNVTRNHKKNDLSFTFLQKQNSEYLKVTITPNKCTEHFQRVRTDLVNTTDVSNIYDSFVRENVGQHEISDLSHFEPKFVSTPKKSDSMKSYKLKQIRQHNEHKSTSNVVYKHEIKRLKSRDASKYVRQPKRLEKTLQLKENKHRSISGWFFEAINESCTTLVKTVKNIFRPKNNLEDTKTKSFSPMSEKHSVCNYSFTNYMHKRDAILKNECSKNSHTDYEDFTMEMSNSCNTCNDTLALKLKLSNDEYLKQTVRKLKLGINLYGCDFKKIAKQLWPQQTYMTPMVLYNLYRKLIIK